jgi:hypothetical protein
MFFILLTIFHILKIIMEQTKNFFQKCTQPAVFINIWHLPLTASTSLFFLCKKEIPNKVLGGVVGLYTIIDCYGLSNRIDIYRYAEKNGDYRISNILQKEYGWLQGIGTYILIDCFSRWKKYSKSKISRLGVGAFCLGMASVYRNHGDKILCQSIRSTIDKTREIYE